MRIRNSLTVPIRIIRVRATEEAVLQPDEEAQIEYDPATDVIHVDEPAT